MMLAAAHNAGVASTLVDQPEAIAGEAGTVRRGAATLDAAHIKRGGTVHVAQEQELMMDATSTGDITLWFSSPQRADKNSTLKSVGGRRPK